MFVCLFEQTIREGSNLGLKSLLKHKKELCNVVVELHNKEPQSLSEVRIEYYVYYMHCCNCKGIIFAVVKGVLCVQ